MPSNPKCITASRRAACGPPCAIAAGYVIDPCRRCGWATEQYRRCLYLKWASVAWPLVTGPLTPSQPGGRHYFSAHLLPRIAPVVEHLAHTAISVHEQIAFVESCRRASPDERIADLSDVDRRRPAGRKLIRQEFVRLFERELRDALNQQRPDEVELGLPRSTEEYPMRLVGELTARSR